VTVSKQIEVVAWIEHDELDVKSGPALTKKIKAALTKKIEAALEPFGKVRACWVHNYYPPGDAHARRAIREEALRDAAELCAAQAEALRTSRGELPWGDDLIRLVAHEDDVRAIRALIEREALTDGGAREP
jgi:hypothetical protein